MSKLKRPALRLALLVCLLIASGIEVSAQESNRDKLSIFMGAGWAGTPSSTGFLGGSTPRQDRAAITGGAELIPFSHLGFAFNVDYVRRKTEVFTGTGYVAKTVGDTFVSGNALFPILVRRPVSPFLAIGVAHERGPGAAVNGMDMAAGARIRMSRHVSLRPELRTYLVHLLSSDPSVLSLGIAYHW